MRCGPATAGHGPGSAAGLGRVGELERRSLGAAALAVGAVGLGCMPMSWAYSASQQRGDRALRTVHAALDAGVQLLDTADMYGPFTNELLVGRALKGRRSDAFVSTKCGLLVGDQHIVANGRPGYVRRACDASLQPAPDRCDRSVPAAPGRPRGAGRGDLGRDGGAGDRREGAGARALRDRGAGLTPGSRMYDETIRQLDRVQQVFPVSAVQAELSVWRRRRWSRCFRGVRRGVWGCWRRCRWGAAI